MARKRDNKFLILQSCLCFLTGFGFLAAHLISEHRALRLFLSYGMLGVEVVVGMCIGFSKHACYRKKSMLCERMALVTLIIIGEGIIGLCGMLDGQ